MKKSITYTKSRDNQPGPGDCGFSETWGGKQSTPWPEGLRGAGKLIAATRRKGNESHQLRSERTSRESRYDKLESVWSSYHEREKRSGQDHGKRERKEKELAVVDISHTQCLEFHYPWEKGWREK